MINDNKNWIFCGGYIDEGISGTAVKNRVNFLKMIESATQGKIDMIVTKEISRFSRNTVDSIKYSEYLLKQGVIVFFLSDNLNTIYEDSEFRLTIMSSLAQDEVRKLSERVKFGINRMIKDRKLIGGNLTGYFKRDGRYEINKKEAFIIKYLFETYVTSKVSLKKIADDLAKMGYLNSKGKTYSSITLAKFLNNPRYKGYYTARLTEVESYKTHKKKKVPKERQIIEKDEKIPAIVSENLWNKANKIYELRKKTSTRHILNSEKILINSKYSCLLYCKECNCVFVRAGGSNRAKSPTWFCKKYKVAGVKSCASPIIKEFLLDDIFLKLFNELIDTNKFINSIINDYKSILNNNNCIDDINDLNNDIKMIEKQKDKLLDLSIKGIIDDLEFKKRNDKFNNDINILKVQLNKLNSDDFVNINKQDTIYKIINYFNLETFIQNQLPNLMKLLINKIEVKKINNDRKHINLSIYFNFNKKNIDIELNMRNK